jgi:hypothetical protein
MLAAVGEGSARGKYACFAPSETSSPKSFSMMADRFGVADLMLDDCALPKLMFLPMFPSADLSERSSALLMARPDVVVRL